MDRRLGHGADDGARGRDGCERATARGPGPDQRDRHAPVPRRDQGGNDGRVGQLLGLDCERPAGRVDQAGQRGTARVGRRDQAAGGGRDVAGLVGRDYRLRRRDVAGVVVDRGVLPVAAEPRSRQVQRHHHQARVVDDQRLRVREREPRRRPAHRRSGGRQRVEGRLVGALVHVGRGLEDDADVAAGPGALGKRGDGAFVRQKVHLHPDAGARRGHQIHDRVGPGVRFDEQRDRAGGPRGTGVRRAQAAGGERQRAGERQRQRDP